MNYCVNLNSFEALRAYLQNLQSAKFPPFFMPNLTINVYPQYPLPDPSKCGMQSQTMASYETNSQAATDITETTNQSHKMKSDHIMRKAIKKTTFSREARLTDSLNSAKKENGQKMGKPKESQSKHVLKNYANAISTFAISDIAIPYLEPIFQREGMERERFVTFVIRHKEYLNNITRVRGMMMGEDEDSAEELALKNCFRSISEVFVKYFAVNWIYESKLLDKRKYINFRFRLLRRIKNPYMFTTMS